MNCLKVAYLIIFCLSFGTIGAMEEGDGEGSNTTVSTSKKNFNKNLFSSLDPNAVKKGFEIGLQFINRQNRTKDPFARRNQKVLDFVNLHMAHTAAVIQQDLSIPLPNFKNKDILSNPRIYIFDPLISSEQKKDKEKEDSSENTSQSNEYTSPHFLNNFTQTDENLFPASFLTLVLNTLNIYISFHTDNWSFKSGDTELISLLKLTEINDAISKKPGWFSHVSQKYAWILSIASVFLIGTLNRCKKISNKLSLFLGAGSLLSGYIISKRYNQFFAANQFSEKISARTSYNEFVEKYDRCKNLGAFTSIEELAKNKDVLPPINEVDLAECSKNIVLNRTVSSISKTDVVQSSENTTINSTQGSSTSQVKQSRKRRKRPSLLNPNPS